MTRAVLDANVFVSAALSPRGSPAKILTAWRAERFHLVISPAILEKIGRVFHYPKIVTRHRWPEEKIRQFIEDLAHLAILTPGRRMLKTSVTLFLEVKKGAGKESPCKRRPRKTLV